jgi:glycerophosphoryl diester phosphodiesterase
VKDQRMKTYREWISSVNGSCAVIAHRGAWHHAPENSIASIHAAADLGCTVAEVDVRLTKDGALILMHDETTLRMTGVELLPEEVTLAELRALTLKERDGLGDAKPTDHLIPTLEEALEAARGRIYLDLDLKDRGIAPQVIACVKRAGLEDLVDLKFAIETAEDTARLRQMQDESGIAIMALANFGGEGAEARFEALLANPPFMVESKFDDLGRMADYAKRLADVGTAVWANTLDVSHSLDFNDTNAMKDADRIWGAFLAAGISAIQTDESEALIAWLNNRRAAA